MAEVTVIPDCPCCAAVAPAVVEIVVPDPTTVGGQPTLHCPCVTHPGGAPKALNATVTPVSGIACLAPFTLPLTFIGCTNLGESGWYSGNACLPNRSGCRILFDGIELWEVSYAACSRTVAGPPNECGHTHHPTEHNISVAWEFCSNLFQPFGTVLTAQTQEFPPAPVTDPHVGTVALHSFTCDPVVIVYRVTLPADNPYFPNGVFDVTITE
jgi:hypothetical protein